MRGLNRQQLLSIELLLERFPSLELLGESVIEKDILVKDVVLEVAKAGQDCGFDLIFSGGTSLSQGWGIIERMSEDVDFRVISPEFPSKNAKSKALSGLKSELGHSLRKAGFDIDGEIAGRDNNRYIRANVVYDSEFVPRRTALRPYIKIELMGVDRPFNIERREVKDILERYEVGNSPSSSKVPMVSLPDIISDKVISYLRRTAEHRANPELEHRYDPRLVRHIYDVHCIVQSDRSVTGDASPIFASTLEQEIKQYGGQRFPTFRERPLDILTNELGLLFEDQEARGNYQIFVNDLVYGEKPSFDEVTQTFHTVATKFLTAFEISLTAQAASFTTSPNTGNLVRGLGRRL